VCDKRQLARYGGKGKVLVRENVMTRETARYGRGRRVPLELEVGLESDLQLAAGWRREEALSSDLVLAPLELHFISRKELEGSYRVSPVSFASQANVHRDRDQRGCERIWKATEDLRRGIANFPWRTCHKRTSAGGKGRGYTVR